MGGGGEEGEEGEIKRKLRKADPPEKEGSMVWRDGNHREGKKEGGRERKKDGGRGGGEEEEGGSERGDQ